MWIIFALAASVLWGVTYVINEQVYRKISIFTSLGITSLLTAIGMLLIAYQGKLLKQDLTLIAGSKPLFWLVVMGTLALMLAELFIGLSITNKNAALAGLIEISYPIFIILFTCLIFRENQITMSTIVGGILIFLGVLIIYYFNK